MCDFVKICKELHKTGGLANLQMEKTNEVKENMYFKTMFSLM